MAAPNSSQCVSVPLLPWTCGLAINVGAEVLGQLKSHCLHAVPGRQVSVDKLFASKILHSPCHLEPKPH